MSMDPKVLRQFMNATAQNTNLHATSIPSPVPPATNPVSQPHVAPEPQMGKVYTADTRALFPHVGTTTPQPQESADNDLQVEDLRQDPSTVEQDPSVDESQDMLVALDTGSAEEDSYTTTATINNPEVSPAVTPQEEPQPESATAEDVPEVHDDQSSSEPIEEAHKDDNTLAIYVRRVERRMNSSGPTMIYHRNICNRSLSYFLNDYRRVHAIDDEIKIQGVLVKATRSAGLWDEGGAVAESGSVLIVTDPNGDPLPPVKTDIDPHAVNGKHALVPVWPNCYVLMGGHHRGDDILGVYRITEVITQSEAGQRYPRLVCKLIASCQSGNVWKENVPGTFWTKNHPAVKAACRRMFEIDASLPAYVCPYREHFFDTADYTDCLADQEFLNQLQTFDTVEQGYAKAGLCLGVLVDELPREHRALLTVSLNYFANQDLVVVFLLGVDYNYDEHTSKGGRKFYGRIVLHENDVFWYPDKTAATGVSYAEVKDALVRSGGTMVTTFRRMLPIPDVIHLSADMLTK